uniref:Uncharacterized protein n=1 Tax=Cacopsylla melanoneura TaxID=428564 RepID=A0A8D9DMV1_9HEMI
MPQDPLIHMRRRDPLVDTRLAPPATFKCNFHCHILLEQLSIGTLENRRQLYNLVFIYNIINNKTVNTEVVNKIKIIVPNIRLRNRHSSRYFDIPRCTPTYRDSTLISAMQTFNEFSRELDLDMRMKTYRVNKS